METKADLDYITNGHTRENFSIEKWINEQKIFTYDVLIDRVKTSNFKFKKFKHLGQNLYMVDLPTGWKLNNYYRWKVHDMIGGYVEMNFNLREINHINDIDLAIFEFKKNVKSIKTAIDGLLQKN